MPGDSLFDKVSLLLKGDGTNGSAPTDSGPSHRSVLAINSVSNSTAQSKYGGSSLIFNGSNYFVSFANGNAFQVNQYSEWCIEAWIYLTATPGSWGTICGNIRESPNAGWRFMIGNDRKINFSAYLSSGGSVSIPIAASAVIPLNTWTHVAYVGVGQNIYGFVNGVLDNQLVLASGTTIPDSSRTDFAVGKNVNEWYFPGYMDDLRVTMGDRRHNIAGFTPPDSAPTYGFDVTGVVYDDAGNPAQRTVRGYRRDTGALIAETTSDPVTGIYTFQSPTSGEVQRVVLDDSAGALYNDIIDRVIAP